LQANSWQGGAFSEAPFPAHPTPPHDTAAVGLTGRSKVPSSPSLQPALTTPAADSPGGPTVDRHLAQHARADPAGSSASDLREAVVTLPEGMSVNPSSANGLQACSAAQVELDGPEPAACPDASKLGSVEIDTPLVDHPVQGSVYLARQGENKF